MYGPTMAVSTDPPLPSLVVWDENSVSLKDFILKHHTPNIVRVTKGQYRNIGVAKSATSELYIHSIKTSKKVLAEGVKVKEGKRITTVDQKFSLPVTYQGWFELLSEDGKAIKAIQSVQELARVFPQRCLVRDNIKGYMNRETGEVALDKTRMVTTGEQLSLVGDLLVPIKGNIRKKLLKCTDQTGEAVFFSLDQKGLFSPIAGQGNISGVHNVKGLLEKFRLPIMVRLVHGIIPSRLDKGSFTGVFRLLNIYGDETAFICPLRRDAKMVPISTREALKLSVAQNFIDLKELDECKYYQTRCSKMVASYQNSIHVLVNPPDTTLMSRGKPDPKDAVAFHRQSQPPRQVAKQRVSAVGEEKQDIQEQNILFDEVDDIYQYVRDGGRPPPPRPRPAARKSDPTPVPRTGPSEVRPQSYESNVQIDQVNGSRPGSSEQPVRKNSKGDLLNTGPIITTSGSVDILNSSSSNSADDNSPVTTLSMHKDKDENYWEEPAYEDLKKMVKDKERSQISHDMSSSPTVPSQSPGRELHEFQKPVENLRQMYKLQSPTDTRTSQHHWQENSDLTSSTNGNAKVGPPVRAKRPEPQKVEPTIDHLGGVPQGAFPKRNAVTPIVQGSAPDISHEDDKAQHPKNAPKNNAYAKAPPPVVGRYLRANSVQGGSSSWDQNSRQYVAVARVGAPSSHNSNNGDDTKVNRIGDQSQAPVLGRVENARKKWQGLYL